MSLDMPGPTRPVPTVAGSAFAFFDPAQAEVALTKGLQVAAAQKAGLIVPVNGIIRPLPGASQ